IPMVAMPCLRSCRSPVPSRVMSASATRMARPWNTNPCPTPSRWRKAPEAAGTQYPYRLQGLFISAPWAYNRTMAVTRSMVPASQPPPMHPQPPPALMAGPVGLTLLILTLALVGLSYVTLLRDKVATIHEHHTTKVDLLHEMSRVIRERSLRMYAMYFK